MAQSAKDYAKQQLGELDLGYLDKERKVANDSYNTSKGSLENNYNNLIEQIGQNKDVTKKGFNTGRATVAENAFTQGRLNQLDVGSRVTGKSGLQELGDVGNRIETGRQYSNLANTYYDDMKTLDTTEKQSATTFGLDQQGLLDQLNQMLTGVDSRGAEAKNSYNMQVGQLAESVQGRWDANANAQAALAQARSAAAQARSAASSQLAAAKKSELVKILTNGGDANNQTQLIKDLFGVDYSTAYQVIAEANKTGAKDPRQNSYNGSDYINRLLGI